MNLNEFESRKKDHITHSLNEKNQASGMSGLDSIKLTHEALPELNFNDTHLKNKLFSSQIATPFYISGMTAGHKDAARLNELFAKGCETRGWIFGVGSQRRDFESKKTIEDWKAFSRKFPKLFWIGNTGLSQLREMDLELLKRFCGESEMKGLAIHLNSLQECLQPEGTPFFKDGLKTIERAVKKLKIPVIVKETGCGFSLKTLKRLKDTGLFAIDISGLGGTHWGRIEGMRAADDSLFKNASATFSNWGISTVDSVQNANQVFGKNSKTEIWASGGVRSGLDAAKLIALGATRVGYAKPALEAALKGEIEFEKWMELQEFELKIALFCTGSRILKDLRKSLS